MTNYELDKLARGVAKYLVEEIKSNDELLDIIFPPKTMDIEEAATFLKIPTSTLYQKASIIPHLKTGKRLLFTDRGLMRWLQRGAM
jgi:hypothetical protein